MTLWATIVAERLGHSHDAALSMGRVVAGLNAHSKARAIGLLKKDPKSKTPPHPPATRSVALLGRNVPLIKTHDGLRALAGEQAVSPKNVEAYLLRSFGENLKTTRAKLEKLAASQPARALGENAYSLYEQFRPSVPKGAAGWGAKGQLDLDLIEQLAKPPSKRRRSADDDAHGSSRKDAEPPSDARHGRTWT